MNFTAGRMARVAFRGVPFALAVFAAACGTIHRAQKAKEEVQTAKSQQESRQKDMERATSRNWIAARKTLRIGGTALAKQPDGSTKSSVFINGRDYVDNDFVSVNHNGHRFTWRVTGLTENGTLKLERVRARPLENSSLKGTKK